MTLSPVALVLLLSTSAIGFQAARWGHNRQRPPLLPTARRDTFTPRRRSHTHQRGSRLFVSSFDEEEYLRSRPIPSMPSPLFLNLAQSQMELLAFSVNRIKAMSLYLPQENAETGQLEFLPAIIHPNSERVFIANDASSGEAPSLPRTLTRLPGFQHATSLLPGYPMVSSNSPGVGTVEEVICDPVTRSSTVSVPLLQGSQTVGVFLIWSKPSNRAKIWSKEEKEQISRAAQSLSLALSMDAERKLLEKQSETLQTQLSDALHQVKNPIQALRTYGKLLQRKLADSEIQDELQGGSPQLLELAQHLMVQSDRVVDLMSPFDTIVNSLPAARQPYALNPYQAPISSQHSALTPWSKSTTTRTDFVDFSSLPDTMNSNSRSSNETIEFSRGGRTIEYGPDDGTIEFGFSNGTIDFTRDTNNDTVAGEAAAPPRNVEPSIFANSNGDADALEMGFVMDILDPIFSGGKALASEKNVDLQIQASDDLPGVWTSPKALQEAVANVLDNALKYVVVGKATYPRVVVKLEPISSSSSEQQQEQPGISLRISDNGPGIPPDEQDAIFQRGYRGEQTRAVIDGSGIGLDITQSMVARMGGELRLVETSGRGSTFEFILYRNKPTKK